MIYVATQRRLFPIDPTAAEQALTVDLLRPRTYLHLVRGELSALDVALKAGDALALTHHPHLTLFATEPAEFLLFALAE